MQNDKTFVTFIAKFENSDSIEFDVTINPRKGENFRDLWMKASRYATLLDPNKDDILTGIEIFDSHVTK